VGKKGGGEKQKKTITTKWPAKQSRRTGKERKRKAEAESWENSRLDSCVLSRRCCAPKRKWLGLMLFYNRKEQGKKRSWGRGGTILSQKSHPTLRKKMGEGGKGRKLNCKVSRELTSAKWKP